MVITRFFVSLVLFIFASGVMKIVLANPQNTSRPTAIWTASEKRGNFYYVMSAENIQLVLRGSTVTPIFR